MIGNFDVGCFIYHDVYGYGEITTVNEDHTEVFIDFRKGHYDWFKVCDLERSSGVFPVEKAFIRVLFKPGDNVWELLRRYSEYEIVEVLF